MVYNINMIDKIFGEIEQIKDNSVILKTGSFYFELLVSNPYSYKVGDSSVSRISIKIKEKNRQNEDEILLFGFKTALEKALFLKLIKIQGIGPKTAIAILAKDNAEKIIEEIQNGNINYLSSVPKLGLKTAQKIIIELSDKLSQSIYNTSDDLKMVSATLKSFGYSDNLISKAISKIEKSSDLSKMVKDALRVIASSKWWKKKKYHHLDLKNYQNM